MRVEVPIDIHASPARVWSVLVDVEHWPEWTASMDEVRLRSAGAFGLGSVARIKQPRLLAATWIVNRFEPEVSFAWTTTRAGVKVEADHQISPRADGVRVVLSADVTGALSGVLATLLRKQILRSVTMEANGLKQRAESAG